MSLSATLRHAYPGFSLDVTLVAPAGITALFGPSGSGKTSIIRALAGLLTCDEASITLAGLDLKGLPPHKRGIGYVFQDTRLFPHLSVLKNLRYGGQAQEEAVINVLGLEALLNRAPHTLSGGEAQRVALGRAIVREPKAFMMDEPLGALDAEFREHMAEELRAL
ncbi:MAG: ATP-binding cassette domain-containing protein, partial [Pseudomonadota bacterium]